jgi:hypothetical protein
MSTDDITKHRTDIYGEVFTPTGLIDEILDQLPKHVWTNAELSWLDPCAGEGNFFDRVLPRLMQGLKKAMPNEDERQKHILTKMLTMVEINPANVRILRSKYEQTKIHAKDFLDLSLFPEPAHFDIILANPPYQAPKHASYTGSAGNRTLWDDFLKKSMKLTTPKTGLLGFITPANWRRPDHPLWHTMRGRILYLHIYGKSAGIDFFRVQTRFDLYVLKAESTEHAIPLLVDERGESHINEIQPSEWAFLPNYAYKLIRPLLVKNKAQGIPVIHDSSTYDARHLSKNLNRHNPYPVIHTLNKEGIGLRYAVKRDPRQFGVPKVILNLNEKQYPVNDWQGKYGMSQLSFGLPIRSKKEGEEMIRCIENPLFQEVLEATKWGSFQTDHRMFTYFRRDFCRFFLKNPKIMTRRLGRRQTISSQTRRRRYQK